MNHAMPPHEPFDESLHEPRQAARVVRLLAALAIFLGCVFAGLWAATHHGTQSFGGKGSSKKLASLAAEDDEARVFYRSLGQAPAGFPEDEKNPSQGLQTSYTLELKLATNREEAERLINFLNKQGLEAFFTPLSKGGKVIYRVRRGMYKSQGEAQEAMLALKNDYQIPARVVRLQ